MKTNQNMKRTLILGLLLQGSSLLAQNPNVDFKTGSAQLSINPVKKNVEGSITYTFQVQKPTDTIRINAVKMDFSKVLMNNRNVNFKKTDKELLLFEGYQKGNNEVTIHFEAYPIQAMYFIAHDNYQDVQIWTQGQGRNNSHWIPCFDDVNEKVLFDLKIDFHKDYEVLSNGNLIKKEEFNDLYRWHYKMNREMSSYLLAIAIGKFKKQEFTSNSGIKNELYLHQDDITKFEPTYRHSKTIFDFLEDEIGVSYPWQIYRQVPVWDFFYGGMENTTTTLFSQNYVIDSNEFEDKNYINVNAHELAHQWFGNLITAKSSKHHWLHEGFATYYALLAEKKIFGDDYYYYKLFKNAQKIQQASISDRIPILNEKASSLSFYQKGAWVVHLLREEMGEKAFKKCIKNYLEDNAYKTVDTDDFFGYVKKYSNINIDHYKERWLESANYQHLDVEKALTKNKSYVAYQQFINQLDTIDSKVVQSILKSNLYTDYKNEILQAWLDKNPLALEDANFIQAIISMNNHTLTLTVLEHIEKITQEAKNHIIQLLNSSNYSVQELAFLKLVENFPDEIDTLTQKLHLWETHPSKNIQITYSAAKLISAKTQEEFQLYYVKLLNYTGTNFEANHRQLAIDKLMQLGLINKTTLKSISYGVGHINWRFAKYCRDLIKKISQDKNHLSKLNELISDDQIPYKEKIIIQRLLNNL